MSEFNKIETLIRERGIRQGDCEYHTQRSLEGGKGRIRVLALKADMIARAEYICPHCGKYGYGEAQWKRPFAVSCNSCRKRITVQKMRAQFKKEAKKEQEG